MLERRDPGAYTIAIIGHLSPNKKKVTLHSTGESTPQGQHLILSHTFLNTDEGNTLNTDVVLKTILKKNHLRTGNGHPDEENIESIYDY